MPEFLLLRAETLLTPTPLIEPDQWGAANREYPETSGKPGKRDPSITAYITPFARKVHAGTHKRCVAVTSAQAGKTETFLDCIGARIDQRPAPILYVGPSKDFVTDQFEPRLMDLLDQADSLKAKVARGKRMKKLLKTVGGCRIRLAYAGSSTSLKSDPFGLGLVDEYDEMMSNIKGQGDPLGLAEARGDTYADFVTAVVSTPSQGLVLTEVDPVNGLEMWAVGDPDNILSPIWKLWQSGTRHHFAWACPHCGEYFIPRLKDLRWPKGATPAQARRAAYVQCPQGCAEPILDHHKPEMIAGGVQIAPGQTIEEAREGINEPDNDTWSCWTSGLCSPFVTFGDRAARYLTALATGETDKIQTAVNAGFAECYDPAAEVDAPGHEQLLKANRLPYARGTVPAGGIRLAMSVDVQAFMLYYVIRAFGARGTSWLVDHGQLHGPTAGDDVWEDLADLMMTPVSGMQIEKVFIDSGYRPGRKDQVPEHKVYEFCRRWSWMCSPVKGKDVQHPPYKVSKIEVKPDGKRARYSIDLVWLSTDFFKSLVMARMMTPATSAGAFYLHADTEEDYAKQVTSEVRMIEKGKPVWKQRSKDNHYFDCFDAETEFLTKAGWVKATSLSDDMEFATVNLTSDHIEYQRPTRLVSRYHSGEMVKIEGRVLDLLVTPNHRMVTNYKWDKTRSDGITLARDLSVWHGIKRTASWRGCDGAAKVFPPDAEPGCAYQPGLQIDAGDWAEFLGWYVSEGHPRRIGKNKVVFITQNPGPKADRIRDLLDRMGVDWRLVGGRQFCIKSRRIWAAVQSCYAKGVAPSCYSKVVPDEIKNASSRAIDRFLEGAILGDGWVQNGFRTYATTSERLAGDMQELFLKVGSSANVRMRVTPPCRIRGGVSKTAPQFHVSECKTRHALLRRANGEPLFQTVPFSGMVYCATVPNGTLIVRRNGKMAIAGNCESMLAAIGYTWNVQRIPEGVRRDVEEEGLQSADVGRSRRHEPALLASAPAAQQSRRERFAAAAQRMNR